MTVHTLKKLLQGIIVYIAISVFPVIAQDDQASDPFEKYNRPVFEFNMFLDRAILKPVAKVYTLVTPKSVRQPLETFIWQFSYPVSAFNYALQGDFKNAGRSLLKVSVNFILTLGMGDVPLNNTPYQHQTATQTMSKAGIGMGPYIVVPFTGHNMARGHVGKAIDGKAQSVFSQSVLKTPLLFGLQTIITRAKIMDASDNFEATSLDYYATVRSVTIQRENAYSKKSKFEQFDDFDFSQ